ncbi:hypothetical protein D3C84_1158690 [compost metagenome]
MVNVGGIDKVHTLIKGFVDDAPGSRLVRLSTEHHRPQTQGRNLEGTAAQVTVIHVVSFRVSIGYGVPYRAPACSEAHGLS